MLMVTHLLENRVIPSSDIKRQLCPLSEMSSIFLIVLIIINHPVVVLGPGGGGGGGR